MMKLGDHLPGITALPLQTTRLATRVLTVGPKDGEPVLLLHGNLSSATMWEETMLALPSRFRGVAPDQRGYGLSDPGSRIDATRGWSDWADDVIAWADHFGWEQFHLVGHSLGGCVAWAVLGSRPQRLRTVTLVAPGPPCGFGGARGLLGTLNHADGAGSGAGLIHPEFARRLGAGERDVASRIFSPRAVMNRGFWKPSFRPAREEELLTAMLQVHVGGAQFPGDAVESPHWPGFAPGQLGPINAMSPRYNQGWRERLLQTSAHPPVLWIYGEQDTVITDKSLSDPGFQGMLSLRPEWPGKDVFPAQPLLSQVTDVLDHYAAGGGLVHRLVLPDVGHTPYLENPVACHAALSEHLTSG